MVDTRSFIEEKIEQIRNEVGEGRAVAAASGGVDSTVVAVLGHLALGDKLTVIFMDDGLMREDEADSVVRMFRSVGVDCKVYNVQDNFFNALAGMYDPELKRKAFRETFYRTLAKIVIDLKAEHLLQGTIAADVVETVRGVKTQHNVLEQVGLSPMEKFGFRVVEPLKELYKPEVREVARALGLNAEAAERKPFPGPGLSVRVLGEVTPERVGIVRRATEIVEEETANIACFQALAVLMNDMATGLSENGGRKYGNILVVRVVESADAMTAKPGEIPWKVLRRIMERVTGEIPSVTRVLYDLTDKPPATIEFE